MSEIRLGPVESDENYHGKKYFHITVYGAQTVLQQGQGMRFETLWDRAMPQIEELKGLNYTGRVSQVGQFSDTFNAYIMFDTDEEHFFFMLRCPVEVLDNA
tara:strand:- start:4228 stop:4530 length:303 start_codon:yes stop_codon:yes gene_type:complete